MAHALELFPLTAALAPAAPPAVDTPLGRLGLHLVTDAGPVAPDATFATAGGRAACVWAEAAPARVELVLAEPALALPPGVAVAGAVAAVWRMRATGSGETTVRLRCDWAEGATWTAGGPDGGENLDAQTWTDGRTKVTVGLPDLGGATAYRRDGFEVAVAVGPGGAVFQTHFACAWGPDVPDDAATWFAADLTPAQALAGVA